MLVDVLRIANEQKYLRAVQVHVAPTERSTLQQSQSALPAPSSYSGDAATSLLSVKEVCCCGVALSELTGCVCRTHRRCTPRGRHCPVLPR